MLKTPPMLQFLDKSRLPETNMRKKKPILKMFVQTCLPKPYDLYYYAGVTKVKKANEQLEIYVGEKKHTHVLRDIIGVYMRHVKSTDWE